MKVQLVVATPAHAEGIVELMREVSIEEVRRQGNDFVNIVADAISKARYCWLGLIDEKIVCMIGVESPTLLSDVGYLWLITTPEVESHSFIFVRWSQRIVKALESKFKVLHGYVDKRNKRSVLWLKWLGFTVAYSDSNTFWRHFEKRTG